MLFFFSAYATIPLGHVQTKKCSHSDTLTRGKHQKQISHNRTSLSKEKEKKLYILLLHKHTVLLIQKTKKILCTSNRHKMHPAGTVEPTNILYKSAFHLQLYLEMSITNLTFPI